MSREGYLPKSCSLTPWNLTFITGVRNPNILFHGQSSTSGVSEICNTVLDVLNCKGLV